MDGTFPFSMRMFTTPGSENAVPGSLLCGVPGSGRSLELSCRLNHGAEVFGQALEVQDPADQIALLLHATEPAPAKPPQPVPVLALAEELFDELATPLGQAVRQPVLPHADPGMGGAAAAGLGGDVGHDVARQQRLNEGLMEEALVGAQREGREPQPALHAVQQSQTAGLLRGGALEDLHSEAEQEAITVFHEGLHRVTGISDALR